jgi:hypothetical protein
VLPSTTTHTGAHWARAAFTVENTFEPGLKLGMSTRWVLDGVMADA